MSVNIDEIVVSDKFKQSDEGFKYFIGYQKDEIVKPLCIIFVKWVDTPNTFKTVVKICLFLLKMINCWINTMKFGMWLKKVEN